MDLLLYKFPFGFRGVSRKVSSALYCNFLQIRALSGLVFLLQHDHQMEASNWYSAIAAVIKRLVSVIDIPKL